MLLARFLQIALLFSRHLIKISLNRLSWIECRSYDHFIRSSSKLSHKSADSKMLRHSNPLWSRFKIFMDRVVRDHLVPTSSKISCHIPIMATFTANVVKTKIGINNNILMIVLLKVFCKVSWKIVHLKQVNFFKTAKLTNFYNTFFCRNSFWLVTSCYKKGVS